MTSPGRAAAPARNGMTGAKPSYPGEAIEGTFYTEPTYPTRHRMAARTATEVRLDFRCPELCVGANLARRFGGRAETMRRAELLRIVTYYLTHLRVSVETSNSLNLQDLNVHAEAFFRDLLNLALGLQPHQHQHH